jgi:hypothetical protein
MQAILLTLLAVGLAAGVGFLAHRLLRFLTQKLWLRILLSLIPGGMTFFAAGAYLLFTFSVIPATDDPVFSYQDSLSVIIAQSSLPVISPLDTFAKSS